MKHIAILGFGIEGKDAAQYFLSKGAEITVFDKKEKSEIDTSGFDKIKWKLGGNYLSDGLERFGFIVRSPGIRPDTPEITKAVAQGAKLTSTTKIFFDECKKPIIAVTGTKGKGTTASLIAEGLKACGKKVTLLGNIGKPLLESLGQANKSDYVVLELSSFQTMDLTKSPHVVVITNITSDHMDWHKNQEEYEKSKEQLWINQTKKDYLVLNRLDHTSVRLAHRARGRLVWYTNSWAPGYMAYIDDKDWKMHDPEMELEIHYKVVVGSQVLGETSEIKLLGPHNVLNTLAALCAIHVLKEDVKKAWQGIIGFKGLEHRLEKVAEINGVTYVNDSYATNPEPTIAAIKSFKEPKVLILGGSSKGANFTKLAKEIQIQNVTGVVLIGDESKKIKRSLLKVKYKGSIVEGANNMVEIVTVAKSLAKSGYVVLLSPACASFGLFKDYKDRGLQFKKAVLSL